MQGEIAEAAYAAQRRLESGADRVVGVNVHQEAELEPVEVLAIDPQLEEQQVARLRAVRARRDGQRACAALGELAAAAGEGRNVMPAILDCVRAEVTLGEISDALRGVYGEYREAGLD